MSPTTQTPSSIGALFFYRGSPALRILDAPPQSVPTDFLYGFDRYSKAKTLRALPKEVAGNPYRRLFLPFEKWVAKKLVLGCPFEIYPMFRKDLAQAEVIVCLTDAIALSILFYKSIGLIQKPVVALFQSLPERLKYFENDKLVLKTLSKLLSHADQVITLAKVAHGPLSEVFGVPSRKLSVYEFGVDESFWTLQPSSPQTPGDYIVTVGNDMNRDYQTFANALPESIKAKAVTWQEFDFKGKQIEKLTGISDAQLRETYWNARLGVVPSVKLQYESSGLSSILQCMHTGVPVVASYCPALAEFFTDEKHILYYDPQNANDLRAKIERLWSDQNLRQTLSTNAATRVKGVLNTKNMGRQLDLLTQPFTG